MPVPQITVIARIIKAQSEGRFHEPTIVKTLHIIDKEKAVKIAEEVAAYCITYIMNHGE